jgi:membrane protein implicated in regulation of membrane protease activity
MAGRHDHLMPREGPSLREAAGLVLFIAGFLVLVGGLIAEQSWSWLGLVLVAVGGALMFTRRVYERARRDDGRLNNTEDFGTGGRGGGAHRDSGGADGSDGD